MGKWNNRWIPNQRGYRHDNRGGGGRLPPPYPAESSENSVPEWEKKFCYLVGSVPWRKVLNTKTIASCYPDVMNWDDSEARDTFFSAKQRFWAQMNGLPTEDVPLPNPDAYIDKIDWNASPDTSLLMDVEHALLPVGVETEGTTEVGRTGVVDISALTQHSKWQEWNQGIAHDTWDSGGGWDRSNNGGWGKLEDGGWGTVNDVTGEPQFAKGSGNSWDCGASKTNGPIKNIAWGSFKDQSWGWKQPEYFYSSMNTHNAANNDVNFQGCGAATNNGWAFSGNNSWGRNHQPNNFKETQACGYGSIQQNKRWDNSQCHNSWNNNQHNGASAAREWGKHFNNSQSHNSWNNSQHNGSPAWGYGSIQHNGASAARQWGKHADDSHFANSWNNNQRKKPETYYKSSENQDLGNRGDRKRESPNNYAPRSKSPRFQRTDHRRHDQHEAPKPWRNGQSTHQAGSSFKPS